MHEGALQRTLQHLLELAPRVENGVDVDTVLYEREAFRTLLLPPDKDDVYVGLAPHRVVGEAAEQYRRDDVAVLLHLSYERLQCLVEERDCLRELLVARWSLLLQRLPYHVYHPFSQLLASIVQALLDSRYRHFEERGDLVL